MKIAARAVRGVTLIELMVTLAVLMIVLVFATGPFRTLVAQNRITSAVNDFVGNLNLARTLAVMGGSPTTVCPDKSGACGTASDWGNGAMVFTDADATNADGTYAVANQTFDAGEVVKARWAVSPNITVNANAAAITYNRDGSAVVPAAGSATWLFCDRDGRASPRIVAVYAGGTNSLYKPTDCSAATP